ncbi:MAG: HIT domain-containing protein [Candidatus Saccharimonas aalborgensis]
MEDSIFTNIIKGEIPCHKIYEDEYTFAFLDIHPIQPGQVLVVPKTQIATVWDMPPDEYHHFMDTVLRIGKRLCEVYPDKAKVGLMIEGLEVDHVHAKVFAFSTSKEYRHLPDMAETPDHNALARDAEKIRIA